jgi:aromatic-L-amino-acid/L-tryptophan decarboxylase
MHRIGGRGGRRFVQQRWASSLPALPEVSSPGLDWEVFRHDAHRLVDFIADRHLALEQSTPTSQSTSPGGHWEQCRLSAMQQNLQRIPDATPAPFQSVVDDVRGIESGLIDWQSKGFLSFFPGQLSPASLLGEMLALSFNHAGFSWSTCPASTQLEFLVVNAVSRLLGLPDVFRWSPNGESEGGGSIHPNATEGLLTALVAAREVKLQQMRHNGDRSKLTGMFVCYASDQAHFSVDKACKVLGIHLKKVKTILNPHVQNFPMHEGALEECIAEDMMHGKIPLVVVGTVGTTGTCALDPVRAIGQVARNAGAWFHVDAAYAGAAALCPELRQHVFDGIELCDSVSVNGSKWMAMSMGCSFLFTRHLGRIADGMTSNASYVPKPPAGLYDLKDLSIGMARPWVSLKVYSALRCVGVEALQSMIRRHVLLAAHLDSLLRSVAAIDCVVKPTLGLVVFRVRMFSDEDNQRFQQRLCQHRNILVGSSRVADQTVLRVSLAHVKLTYEDVDCIFNAIVDELNAMESMR